MSEASKENGSTLAFPHTEFSPHGQINAEHAGMTKRELIAMGQMKAWRMAFRETDSKQLAKRAIEDAEALLEALE